MTPWCEAHQGVEFSIFVNKYLSEIETEFENTLACLSGAQMGSNHEKTGGRKSRDTLPLRIIRVKLKQLKHLSFRVIRTFCRRDLCSNDIY